MIRSLAFAFNAIFKSRTSLVSENLCLGQPLIVLKRHQIRPQLRDADRRFWILACQLFSGWSRSLIAVSRIPLSAGIVRAGKPTGAGDHAARQERDVERSNPSSVSSFAVWHGRIHCGGNAESRRSWHVLALRYVRVPSPDTCGVNTVECPRPVGHNSWLSIATKSGRATYLPFRPSGFRHCTYSSSFVTVVVNSYMRGSGLIPIRCGWRNK